jgi:hypothetical protein
MLFHWLCPQKVLSYRPMLWKIWKRLIWIRECCRCLNFSFRIYFPILDYFKAAFPLTKFVCKILSSFATQKDPSYLPWQPWATWHKQKWSLSPRQVMQVLLWHNHRYLKNIDCSSFVMCPLLAPHLPRHFWLFFFFFLAAANNSTKETNKADGTCHWSVFLS